VSKRDFLSIQTVVARCASRKREIQAAYIFGSAATGRTRRDSDVDVAVLVSGRIQPDNMFEYRLKLMADLGSALHRSDVDVVILNEAPPLLAHRVLSKGKLIFERSASARIRFQVNTANRYADLVPMFETQIHYLKKSVRDGRIVG
jgi:predicted nucleotidyltransferase